MAKSTAKAIIDRYGELVDSQDAAVWESWDIQTAANVLGQIAGMISNERDTPENVNKLTAILRALQSFIDGEIGEVEQFSSMGKGLDLSYAKRLGIATLPDLAAKFTARNEIKHYAFIWGDPEHVDIDTEFFTPQSEFWAKEENINIPLTWDHAQDKRFNDMEPDPRIGTTVKWGDDEYGRWAISVLDTDKKYRQFVDEFIEQKAVGYSSDTAPQYTIREHQGKGTFLKRWPWFGGALTPAPCEPRMKDRSPEFLKSIGFAIPETPEIKQAWAWQAERLNFLKIQSNL